MNKEKKMKLGSLFDGSGGFPLGGMLEGIEPVWASEIELFPIKVTRKHFPDMKHLGDVSKIDGSVLEPVDVITFGSPCQDMSMAGSRQGLEGEKSCLFHQAIRIIKEMRKATNGKYPKYAVWENVPGAFSSNKGEDFRQVLEEFVHIKDESVSVPKSQKWSKAGSIVGDDYSIAWRVLDAQYWGVPQRRKRIYLVADFTGRGAPQILFESESVSRDLEQGCQTGENATGSAGTGVKEAGTICLNDQGGMRMDVSVGCTNTLRAQASHPPLVMGSAGFCTECSAKARSIGYEEEKSPTIRAGVVPATLMFENHSQDERLLSVDNYEYLPVENHSSDSRVCFTSNPNVHQTLSSLMGTGGNNVPLLLRMRGGKDGGGKGPLIQTDLSGSLTCNNDQTLVVQESKTFDVRFTSEGTRNARQNCYETNVSRTINTGSNAPNSNQGGIAVVTIDGNGARPSHKGNGCSEAKDPGAVTHPVYTTSKHSFHTRVEENIVNTLVATDYKDPPIVLEETDYIVRRLTPTECARLQGFPDWWCENLEIENPTEEEITFWQEAFKTYQEATGAQTKPKTEKQIRSWLAKRHSDSAEYKMWGNGVALPCVQFVMHNIAEVLNENEEA